MTIDWQTVITSVLTTVGGGGVLVAAAAWLVKTVLTDRLAADAEKFKSQLKTDADAEIEKLKNSLQIVALEHQVRFTNLHERRAELIADLYARLVTVYRKGELFVLTSENNPDPSKEQEFVEIRNDLSGLTQFFEQHRIFFPRSVCASLDDFLGAIHKNVFAAGIFGRIKSPSEHAIQQSQDAFTKAYEVFGNKIPNALGTLENEFRGMLGVEGRDTKAAAQ